jgi:IS605 OrfB family transposase
VASAGWQQAKAELGRAHARVANLRRDHLHKLTTTLAGEHATIVVEDLHVAGMLGNRRLARQLADAGFAELRRQLGYKTSWRGGRLVVADRFYPSSKRCSGCGWVKAKLSLAERVFRCEDPQCGLVADRDLNAARNLAALVAVAPVAGSGPETPNARGPDASPGLAGQTGLKREAGTSRTLGETGTADAQAPAARNVAPTDTR